MIGIQPTLPGLEVHIANYNTRKALGRAGEELVYRWLGHAGYGVAFTRRFQAGDLRATNPETGELFIVEVKTARQSVDHKWRFTLKLTGKGKTDHTRSDVVILLAVTDLNQVIAFVIPVSVLLDQHQAVITSHPAQYSGKLARYRQPIDQLKLEQ